jgi:anti-sigma-K factor RskA
MGIEPTDHGELHEQAEPYVLGSLTAAARARFETHLHECGECQSTIRSLSAVADALALTVPQQEPASALRARVLGSLGVAATAGLKISPSRRPASSLAPWLAAAASIAIAVALAAYAAALRARVGEFERELRQATLRADSSERQIADLRRALAEGASQMAVLAAPDLQRTDLAGQPPAPQSSGRAFWSRSRGLVFTASNLPAPPAGRTYQLWVLTRQPAPISAGLFKPDSGGRVTARFDTPLDLPQPIGMAVTIEPEGGVSAPTGDKYLVGL